MKTEREDVFTRDLITVVFYSKVLINSKNQLHILAYIALNKFIEKADNNPDQINLPEKEKLALLEDIGYMKKIFPNIIPVNFFYTQNGIFDAFDWLGLDRTDYTI